DLCGPAGLGQDVERAILPTVRGPDHLGRRRLQTVWHPAESWFTTDDTPAIIDADLWDAAQRRLARGTPPTPTTDPGAFGGMARMRKAVGQLEAKLARCRGRLVEVSKDLVGEVEAQLRQTREELEAARKALRDAETADPVRDLKMTAEAARDALWRLESALEGGDRCLLKEALRGILAGVVIGAAPYRTTTGKARHRPRIDGIRLRPGSGLDSLSMLSSSSWASTQ